MDESNVDSLYCLAIPRDTSLFTIRDLTAKHLPLLKEIREKSLEIIKDKFELEASQIRAFLHYLPTFYHLHVHFVNSKLIAKAAANVGHAVLLDDVIDNIENYSPNKDIGDFYQTKNITLEVKEGTKMHRIYKQNKII